MRKKTTLKGRHIVSLPETTVRTIQTKLIRGKNTAEIATKAKVSYYVVNSIRKKMIETGVLSATAVPKRTGRPKKNPTTVLPNLRKTEVKTTETLDKTFTKLIVNDTVVDIQNATSVIVDTNGVKIMY